MPTALITGGARRIGAAITKALHTLGYDVIIVTKQSEKTAHSLKSELNLIRPSSAEFFIVDLTNQLEREKFIQKINQQYPTLDILVNNASVFIQDSQLSPLQDYDTLFDIHVRVPLALSHAFYPSLAKQQGAIINITDIHAKRPLKNYGVYCQSKAALNMQTITLAKSFAPKVRVNAIAPGAILWPEKENELDEMTKAAIIDKTPLKQHGKAEYIADAVSFLAIQPFITGQILAVDGGRSL